MTHTHTHTHKHTHTQSHSHNHTHTQTHTHTHTITLTLTLTLTHTQSHSHTHIHTPFNNQIRSRPVCLQLITTVSEEQTEQGVRDQNRGRRKIDKRDRQRAWSKEGERGRETEKTTERQRSHCWVWGGVQRDDTRPTAAYLLWDRSPGGLCLGEQDWKEGVGEPGRRA